MHPLNLKILEIVTKAQKLSIQNMQLKEENETLLIENNELKGIQGEIPLVELLKENIKDLEIDNRSISNTRDIYLEKLLKIKKPLSWKDVFYTEHTKDWSFIIKAYEAAKAANYPYFSWNDRIYDCDCNETKFTIDDVE